MLLSGPKDRLRNAQISPHAIKANFCSPLSVFPLDDFGYVWLLLSVFFFVVEFRNRK